MLSLATRSSELCAVSRRCTASPTAKGLREGGLISKAHAVGDSVQLECGIGEQGLDEFPEDRILNRTEGRPFGFKSALQTSLAHP